MIENPVQKKLDDELMCAWHDAVYGYDRNLDDDEHTYRAYKLMRLAIRGYQAKLEKEVYKRKKFELVQELQAIEYFNFEMTKRHDATLTFLESMYYNKKEELPQNVVSINFKKKMVN